MIQFWMILFSKKSFSRYSAKPIISCVLLSLALTSWVQFVFFCCTSVWWLHPMPFFHIWGFNSFHFNLFLFLLASCSVEACMWGCVCMFIWCTLQSTFLIFEHLLAHSSYRRWVLLTSISLLVGLLDKLLRALTWKWQEHSQQFFSL